MPESFGKRQRSAAKSRKFAAREERRQIRNQRRADGLPAVPDNPEDELPPYVASDEEPTEGTEDESPETTDDAGDEPEKEPDPA